MFSESMAYRVRPPAASLLPCQRRCHLPCRQHCRWCRCQRRPASVLLRPARTCRQSGASVQEIPAAQALASAAASALAPAAATRSASSETSHHNKFFAHISFYEYAVKIVFRAVSAC